MSLHPSLKISKAGKKHRTVLKRYERMSALKDKGILKDEDSVFGMPKLKIIKVKVKKEVKEEKPKEGEAAVTAVSEPAAPAAVKAPPRAGKEERKK